MELTEIGISESKTKQFNKKNIFTDEDLVKTLPKDYYDFRKPIIPSVEYDKQYVSFVGKTKSELREMNGNSNGMYVDVVDDKNNIVRVTWFNQPYIRGICNYRPYEMVIVCGKLSYSPDYGYQISSPLIYSNEIEQNKKIVPVYRKISGMSEKFYSNSLLSAIQTYKPKEYVSNNVINEFSIIKCDNEYIRKIHYPVNWNEVKEVRKRILFDDLFYFASRLFGEEKETTESDFILKTIDIAYKITKDLPYTLTKDQSSVIKMIKEKAMSGKRVNALVQGDVGCGKTIVAMLVMAMFAENGFQSVIMAPTQVLAKQHYDGLVDLTEKYGFKTAYLHSGMKAKEKREIYAGIKSGDYNFVVGTHSVISKDVIYNNLALVITDEEHKFGVMQREALTEKASSGVHTITMSATPIPRTMAITLYGDNKDVYTIESMPNGRKPVKTSISNNDNDIFYFIYDQIVSGRQCYVVCPLIDESENEKMKDVESVESVIEKFTTFFDGLDNVKISSVTGKNTAQETEEILSDFVQNKTNILISTTVIEVGVNVPNANTIVIRNAERFGLAQLHQLRGRVGRGKYQSYCILKSDTENNERLDVMCHETSGFKIAEADLAQRGTGDLIGTAQSGDNKYVELMLKYPDFYMKIKNRVKQILEDKMMLENANKR